MHAEGNDSPLSYGYAGAALPGALPVEIAGIHEVLDDDADDLHVLVGGAVAFGEFLKFLKHEGAAEYFSHKTFADVLLHVVEDSFVEGDAVGYGSLAFREVNVVAQRIDLIPLAEKEAQAGAVGMRAGQRDEILVGHEIASGYGEQYVLLENGRKGGILCAAHFRQALECYSGNVFCLYGKVQDLGDLFQIVPEDGDRQADLYFGGVELLYQGKFFLQERTSAQSFVNLVVEAVELQVNFHPVPVIFYKREKLFVIEERKAVGVDENAADVGFQSGVEKLIELGMDEAFPAGQLQHVQVSFLDGQERV